MTIYRLIDEIIFPPVDEAEEDGLLAVGGDLSPVRVLYALSLGIFPWYSNNDPVMWWSPEPRFVIFPGKIKISKSLRNSHKKFKHKINSNFEAVIKNCAAIKRKNESGTWITDDMIKCYTELHKVGYGYSFETYFNGELVGGLYGVKLGRVFIGESMFHKVTDASKSAFVVLKEFCLKNDIKIIDCQIETVLLRNFGGEYISRKEYIEYLIKYSGFYTENYDNQNS